MKKNVGWIDRILRLCLAVFLVWQGLYNMDGLNGSTSGILVAAIALIPATMFLTGYCPMFKFFGISSCTVKAPK